MQSDRPVPCSARLRYAPFESVDGFHELVVDPYIRRYLFDNEEMSKSWTGKTLERARELDVAAGLGLWRVERVTDSQPLGFCGFFVFGEEVGPTPQLIFAVKEPFAGQGFATEMGHALIQHARRHAGLEEIPSCMDEPNRGSLRVLLKLGFERVGEVPGAFGHKILMRLPREATEREPRTRAYLGASLDGFIAGPDHDLSWLPSQLGAASGHAVDFDSFLGEVGAVLVGRTTFEVSTALPGPWPLAEKTVLVATDRPLDSSLSNVRPVKGTTQEVVGQSLAAADGRDLYIDGGHLVRAILDAGLIDELILAVVPKLLTRGISLFSGLRNPLPFEIIGSGQLGDSVVQLRLRPTPLARR